MSASIYTEKFVEPDDKMLAYDLAEAKELFDKLCTFIQDEFGDLKREWKFYNKKSGWIHKLMNNKRNVLFIIPCLKYFTAVFTFGDKACDLIYTSDLPNFIKEEVFKATKYAEGRTIRFDVHNETELGYVFNLIRIKLLS